MRNEKSSGSKKGSNKPNYNWETINWLQTTDVGATNAENH